MHLPIEMAGVPLQRSRVVIGNSIGVILPKATLDAWGVTEGDELELTERSLQRRGGFSHQELDQLRLSISFAVVRSCTPREIRAKSLANLHKWKQQGAWVSAFDDENYGYYVDPVDDKTATLPKGWKNRLVNLPPGETEGVKGLCLEPHDLAIAKYAESREKDLIFTRELAQRGLLSKDRLLSLLGQTPIDDAARARIHEQIERDFAAKEN